VGEGGEVAWCSAGIGFKLDSDLEEVARDDTVLVCGGIDVQRPRPSASSAGCGARRARAR
jgi:transcriptional regulator GlxA family with amidase domain